ncbi:MAG: SDR family oxidoreductase [Pelagibacteraceae bacterium]|jgi:NAD(P)-dependent dehydrogenase (short-subunit alcohol dehydrogenase family)|nr:SDR family oxidoreductase [Pelagibacteraceae bacterium]MBT5213853.1 SDR family oxidoreductase [Pelagibacteraceae bacterium]MBT6198395.1 SDR family oxidoreductase [Pelagibacteraceae bacterium]MBT6354797.1 SDR family oxidoreductase [Pelagibacteraceae bacterium]
MDFSNKNILITGAADGLGYAVSKKFAEKNANLFLIDINYEKLVNNNLPNSKNIKCDLSNMTYVEELVDNLSNKNIEIDILIHNAAVLIPKSYEDTDSKYWNEMINISLNSGFILSNYAWKIMKKKKQGIIIFVSSRSGIEGFENESAYCASKHGLEGLMKSLSIEGSKLGIQVFTITPGMFMNTPMSEHNYEDEYKKKWVDPIELAPAFLKLASGNFNDLSGKHVNAWELSKGEN